MQGAPSRPWFRLATMVRPLPPPTQQQPDQAPPPPRPAFSIRPTFTQVPPNVVAPTSLPIAKATSSPPPTISQPLSPLVLSPPETNQPTYEQKTVIMQEKPKGLDNNGRHVPKSNNGSDSDDVGMMRRRRRIITLAGENKGAIMDLTPFSKNSAKKKDNSTPSSSDGEKSGSNSDGKKKKKSKSPLISAIMNSNVQGVNNSLLYNCSTTHHDPGVHLSLSRKPNGRIK